jgi:phosphoribosylformylglycinamidine synthase
MRAAVIQFPGSNCDYDVLHVLNKKLGIKADLVWQRFFRHNNYDFAILPGGFSYGDYLRAGAIAAQSPAMREIKEMANEGKAVLGICNGFQILVESGILPGALLMNDCLTFVCKWVTLQVSSNKSSASTLIQKDKILRMPVAHSEGRYVNEKHGIKELYENEQIIFKYTCNTKDEFNSNPNGSMEDIAGICNLERNVVGLMPHPERASESAISPKCSNDGLMIFESMIEYSKK